MLHQVIVIFDTKALVYSKPLYFPSLAAAIRSFEDAVNTDTSDYAKHPEDYIMFHIGTYEDLDATIALQPSTEIVKAVTLVKGN